MSQRASWTPPFPPYGTPTPQAQNGNGHTTAILIELTHISGDLREFKRDAKDRDARMNRLETKLDQLKDRIESLATPRFQIPWMDLARGLAPWLPGMAIIMLTYLGHEKVARVLTAVFHGSAN